MKIVVCLLAENEKGFGTSTLDGNASERSNTKRLYGLAVHGLLISNGRCIAVDFPGSTYANSINSQGDTVGRYTDTDGKTHGFIAEHLAE
jgi:hypothetical protein